MKKILVILAFILCFLGCQNGNEKVLKMATNANFPPYEFVGDNGQFAGIDIEIAQNIAKKLEENNIPVNDENIFILKKMIETVNGFKGKISSLK